MGKSQQQSSSALPKNWPPSLPYLTSPAHAPNISQSHLAKIRAPPCSSGSGGEDPLPVIQKSYKPGPCSLVRITPITDPLHPAYKQHGLFATANLPPGSFILPYIGELHSSSSSSVSSTPSSLPNNPSSSSSSSSTSTSSSSSSSSSSSYDYSKSDYDLWLDRDADVAVDASRMGNEARFVNDFRGVPAVSLSSPSPSSAALSSSSLSGGGHDNNYSRQQKQKQHQHQQKQTRGNGKGKDYNNNTHSDNNKNSAAAAASGGNYNNLYNNNKSKPNAEFKVAWDERRGERVMGVFVLGQGKNRKGKGIAKGEEILVSYGRGFWEERMRDTTGDVAGDTTTGNTTENTTGER